MKTKEDLIKYLDFVSKDLENWQKNIGPSLIKKIKRLYRFRHKYLLYAFSKIYPMDFNSKTFFGKRIYYNLPENFMYLFFGLMPHPSEVRLTKFIIKNIQPNSIFFDIGANCGFYTLLANFFIKNTGEIHAFEPTPCTFKLLEKTTKNLPRVFLNNIVLSDTIGNIDFYIRPDSQTMNSLIKPRVGMFKRVSVPSTTIDDYCRQINKRPDFMKIDVEESENYVIKGAKDVLNFSDVIVSMEVFAEHNDHHLHAVKMLLDIGYKPYLINSDGDIELISISNAQEINKFIPKDMIFDNLIFKK
ncbi:MAG: FkbM family methyltransferase [Candidatus Pacebacteria bacterium]|nr:FkbM family methyltransferase [Candidatus Paceibacterota bacterium]